jgi:5-methylcytosine-specific restriction endonuclease McrA
MNKVCTKCGENKDLEDYYKDVRSKDAKRSECKSCAEKYDKSDKGKLIKTKYNKSDKGKLTNAKYKKSDKGKLTNAKYATNYSKSERGKLSYAKHMKTEKGKLTSARKNHNRRNNEKNTTNDLTAEELNCIIFLQNYQCIGLNHEGSRYFDEVAPTKDHIKPVEMGGHFIKENVQALCKSCNSSKGAQYIDYRSDIHKKTIKTI